MLSCGRRYDDRIQVGLQEGCVESETTWRSLRRGGRVFADPLARIFADEDHAIEERREIIIGHSMRERLLLVAFTQQEATIRIISARKATRHERKDYEEGLKT
jgi:uncharacterized DUF497 family protein